MTWKCEIDGMVNGPDESVCCGCGNVRFGKIILMASGAEIAMNIPTAVGRSLLKKISAEESRFASEPQFYLKQCSDRAGWVVEHDVAAANPTYLNMSQVSPDGSVLKTGDTLSIKGKLPMTVSIKNW